MADEWENEKRSDLIFEMMTYRDSWPTEGTELDVIEKFVSFFPIRGPTPKAWLGFVRWYRSLPKSAAKRAWLEFSSFIRKNYVRLYEEYDNYKESYGNEFDCDSVQKGDRLEYLPEFFSSKFERISPSIVANEWMLHKMQKSKYMGTVIIGVAVYQMETGDTTTGSFLDLLNKYVSYNLRSKIN
jgi:hypothetical protein